MSTMIISTEVVSGLFMLIILLGLVTAIKEKTELHRRFFVCVLSTTIGLFADASDYAMEEMNIVGIYPSIIKIIAFSMIDVCIVFYSFYIVSLIVRKRKISYVPVYITALICTADILMILVGAITGRFFSFRGGKVVYGTWRTYISAIPIVGVIILMVILAANARYLERKVFIALSSIIVFPLIASVIVLLFPGYELAYPATALASEIIFIYIHYEEITESRIREEVMSRISTLDALTGLKNRRGYNEALEQAKEHNRFGIVFCDLNALKYTNDNFGHVAGDAYIMQFADILRKVFSKTGEICRISGDEFVVLLYDISFDELETLKKELAREIRENNRIASVGYAYGENTSIEDLVMHAEQEMYDDKDRYYSETGAKRRK
ncbi:MAG: diguanylate cyclase [Lachnospiraceae bacterium]|nr:diguanylate cyclase [Lachnospiraceae bacterium]